MCLAHCLSCPCCRAAQQRVIVRDCKDAHCALVRREHYGGLYCERCTDNYCGVVGLLCFTGEWPGVDYDATPRALRWVIKVKRLSDVHSLEASRRRVAI
jgi:hypothetical protein